MKMTLKMKMTLMKKIMDTNRSVYAGASALVAFQNG
jgi:hypothetical protein